LRKAKFCSTVTAASRVAANYSASTILVTATKTAVSRPILV
jgi:hypothetical protein